MGAGAAASSCSDWERERTRAGDKSLTRMAVNPSGLEPERPSAQQMETGRRGEGDDSSPAWGVSTLCGQDRGHRSQVYSTRALETEALSGVNLQNRVGWLGDVSANAATDK